MTDLRRLQKCNDACSLTNEIRTSQIIILIQKEKLKNCRQKYYAILIRFNARLSGKLKKDNYDSTDVHEAAMGKYVKHLNKKMIPNKKSAQAT